MTETLFDKTGAAFSFDHEVDGTAYVRPMVKVVVQTVGYSGDEIHEDEDYEPAEYLVALDRSALFDAPPVAAIIEDIAAKKAEMDALKAEMAKTVQQIDAERHAAEQKLRAAQRQLDEWMKTHKGMIDLGKLLDGEILYPLSVNENSYHRARNIPHIPQMKDIGGLRVEAGDFEKGKEWRVKRYLSDRYHTSFQFFDTDEERAAVIRSEFDVTCAAFRKFPDFDTTGHTSSTNLHYGTLIEWVKTHPALMIPDDIQKMKAENDAALVEARRAKLAAELAAMEATG